MKTYDPDAINLPHKGNIEIIENNFSYHRPKSGQSEKYEKLRFETKCLATLILKLCPPSKERKRAFCKLEESIMWANASIARNE